MDKGFTIKCNECGKETVLTQEIDGEYKYMGITNQNIFIGIMGSEPTTFIICECHNTVKTDTD